MSPSCIEAIHEGLHLDPKKLASLGFASCPRANESKWRESCEQEEVSFENFVG